MKHLERITFFLLGAAFSCFLFELRMLRSVFREELIFYLNQRIPYFITFGLLYLFAIIIFSILYGLIEYITKDKGVEEKLRI